MVIYPRNFEKKFVNYKDISSLKIFVLKNYFEYINFINITFD